MQRRHNRLVMTAARCRGRSLHPVRSFQVAVAARIERQQICNLWRHHPEGRADKVISSLCTAREFCLRSFVPADRRPSACSNLPPLPRQLLRSRIRLSASRWNEREARSSLSAACAPT